MSSASFNLYGGGDKGFSTSETLVLLLQETGDGILFSLLIGYIVFRSKEMIFYITYVVVLFSIIVQGLIIGKTANRIYKSAPL